MTAYAQPRIFFSDLDSGPRDGGENGQGAFVSVYGRGFGASRGTGQITIGGGAAASYQIWTDTKVTFQLGGAANSGEIRLSNAGGNSNAVPFTVRPGSIVFIAPGGSVQGAVDGIAPGDIIYVRDGVRQVRAGTSDGSVTLSRNNGTPGAPKALVGYPGAVATIGQIASSACTNTSCTEGVRTTFASNYWTIANMRLVGNDYGLTVRGTGLRIIGNDMTCPFGSGASACLDGSQSSFAKVYGNDVHDAGFARSSDLYHGIYFSTDSNNIDIGWNTVRNIQGCRGIQFNSTALDNTTGFNQANLTVHDNLIDGTQCDGIVLSTVDPSQGPITVYNNVFVNTGRGPATVEGGGTFSCVYAAGYTGSRSRPGSGVIDVYNNTMVNCGTFRSGNGYGGVTYARRDTTIDVRMRNNIIVHTNGSPYWVNYDGGPGMSGSNNLVFGNGPTPTPAIPGTITADPGFANAAAGDYRLTANSPARGVGVNTGLATDKDGVTRGATPDLGAYQFAPGTGTGGGGGGPQLTVSASSLEAVTTLGTNPSSQSFTIGNPGQQPVDYTITSNRAWMAPSPVRGTLAPGANQVVGVSFSVAGFDVAIYSGTLSINAGGAVRDVNAKLTINPVTIVDPVLTVTNTTFNFAVLDAGGAPPSVQTFRVINTGALGSILRWTARTTEAWVTLSPMSGALPQGGDGQEIRIGVNPAGLGTGAYAGGVIIEPERAANGPIRLLVRLAVGSPVVRSVVNAAAFAPGGVAPRSLITVFGENLGPLQPTLFELTADGRNVRPFTGGVRVLFDSTPGAVLYAATGQVNAIVPRDAGLRRSVQLTVENNGIASPPVTVDILGATPALFTLNGSGGGPAAALNQDTSINTAANAAARGSIVSVYATGLGEVDPSPGDGEVLNRADYRLSTNVTATIGGQNADIQYAGAAPGFVVGLYQINLRVPAGIGVGAQQVVVRASGTPSADGVTLMVR